MLTINELHAIQDRPYKPWTPAQEVAHDSALINGWTAESTGCASVTYRRGASDYVQITVAVGLIDCETGQFSGNGRITYAGAPRHHFTTWASVTAYLDRPKGRPYRPQARNRRGRS